MRSPTLSIRTILLSTISALTLLIVSFASHTAYIEWQRLGKIRFLKEASVVSDKLFDLAEKVAIERGVVFSILYAPDEDTARSLYSLLEISRQETDNTIHLASALLTKPQLLKFNINIQLYETQFTSLERLRKRIDQDIMLPFKERDPALPTEWLKETTAFTSTIREVSLAFSKHFITIDPVVTLHTRFKYMLSSIMEYTGRESAIIGRLITQSGNPTLQEQAQLLQWKGMATFGWEICKELMDESNLVATRPAFVDTESHYHATYDMVDAIFYTSQTSPGTTYPISPELWLELATQVSDSFISLKNTTLKETALYIETLETQAERAIAIHIALLLITLVLCGITFYMVTQRVIMPINTMVGALINTIHGKEVTFIPANTNQQDEVGKLAQVLHAFQQNMDKIRRTSNELERYTKDLERSNKELDDFAYVASHDLKEPLRGIHNHSRFLLEDNETKLDTESVGRLNRLIYLSQRMEKLVNDLLYFSRLGRQELAIQETDMNMVIKDIEETLELFLSERHARITIPASLPVIICDKPRVTEAFRNLITNAVKYNDKPERIVEIGFLAEHPSSDGTPISDVFYVKDNGQGIASEFYGEIFRIFKRLQHTKSTEEEGTGVGLTFVKKIIDRHGGKIWLESEVDKGTIFYISLGRNIHDAKAA